MSDAEVRPPQAQLDRFAEQFSQSPAMRFYGAHLSFPEGKKAVITLPEVRPEHRGGLGTDAVNGGILAALFDLVIGCSPALRDPSRRAATMQLSMSFERPVRGSSVRAEASIDSLGTSTVFSSARILDEQGTVCARCQGVIKVSQMKWSGGESPAFG